MELIERFKHFGEALFETLRWENGNFFTPLSYHYERMKRGADFFEIPYPPFEEFENFLKRKLENLPKGQTYYVKVLLLSLGEGYYGGRAKAYRLETVIKPYKPLEGLLKITLSVYKKHSQNPIWNYKTANFLFNVLVKREAVKKGFYDALVLNEKGNITETSSANFYCLKNGVLYTPPVNCGVLPGVYRRILLEQGKAIEKPLHISELKGCEKFYISNSLLGLREVELIFSNTINIL